MGTPFDAVSVGEGTTLLFRPAPGGVEGYVIDNDALVDTLKKRVLDERGLSEFVDVKSAGSSMSDRLKSASDSVSDPLADTARAFHHQFADPLPTLSAWLRLAPLDAPITEQLLLPLTAGLALFIVLGLWALYRFAAARLEFAARQNNFVSAVTHELKTPLTAIRMHGEMLQEGLLESPEKAQEYYRTITAQAERLSRLIGNVLSLSNIEQGPSVEPQAGDVAEAIRLTESTLRPHIEKSGFILAVELPDDIPAVLRDPDSVEQIFFNLVDNALKYASDATDRRITISAEVTVDRVNVTVRDRGPGVLDAELTKIFESFYRGEEQELTRKNPGTGLGLALVNTLASRMQASVSAKNAEPGLAITVSFERASVS
ncbi:MAG: hypothetical protein HRU17_17350 [Polyangiaceae bacterium]|nr:hypothetical protein [Polyangiaceae bacterium]